MYNTKQCYQCPNFVVSTGVSIVAIDGVDTLVIDIPADGCYCNGKKICLRISQPIPPEATVNQPVAISIGGDTTTVYPILRCDCTPATACQFRTRKKYPLRIKTSATSAVFRSLGGLSCCPTYELSSIPAPATATPAPAVLVERSTTKTTKTTTTTPKGDN